jgi:hypothetical protein
MRLVLGLDAPPAGSVAVNEKPFAQHTRPA